MQSAREFMELYLREKAAYLKCYYQQHRAFGEKYYSEERLDIPCVGLRFAPPSELLSNVETSGDTALAFTEHDPF